MIYMNQAYNSLFKRTLEKVPMSRGDFEDALAFL